MSSKTLWFGIVALWMVGVALVAVFVTMPGDASPETRVGDLEQAEFDLENGNAPLSHTFEGDTGTTPVKTETPEEPTPKVLPEETKKTLKPDPTATVEPGDKTIGFDKTVKSGETSTSSDTYLQNVNVSKGGKLQLADGEVQVSGDWVNKGKVVASKTTLIFDGADQTLEGSAVAQKIILRGGTKRIRSGAFSSISNGNAQPGSAGLYVEAGTTLIIEEGGKWTTPNPYGFQIAGSLVIDGGEFHCRFSNGNGTDRGEESWLTGSSLTIYKGKFVANGDADFSGATINIHDGSLEVNDDIWSTGDVLNIFGGSMRNATHGGMFYMTGSVSVSAGNLKVYQSSNRSLRIHKDASVYCTGGEISINGRAATSANGGIMLGSSATLNNLKINTNTKISNDSAPGSYLSVGGDFNIAKGKTFEAKGFQVIALIPNGDTQGEFIP